MSPDIGRWPYSVQIAALVLFAMVLVLTAEVAVRIFAPAVSGDDYTSQKILITQLTDQQQENDYFLAQQFYLRRAELMASMVLSLHPGRPDIPEQMRIVRELAEHSGWQLQSITPDLSQQDALLMHMEARLEMSALAGFWSDLISRDNYFEINAIDLGLIEKNGLFDLSLVLRAPVNPDVHYLADNGRANEERANEEKVNEEAVNKKRVNKERADSDAGVAADNLSNEGFLLRADGSGFSYLVRDDKGRLGRSREK